ncbi:uncharacterized protein LOC125586119 [Brassica napus]|uniref:uncharacterized protein LOC125586119 n=1 Tax=Brassica napus TaxID=3708 RepID=UPI00207B0529|nr:uncharacterized protein LOC125586119 [Brassica napus]
MGIRLEATVDVVIRTHRPRRHRVEIFNELEDHIEPMKERGLVERDDIKLWRRGDKYKSTFSSKETWKLTRVPRAKMNWSNGIWFAFNTPKYSFIAWLAMLNRLATGDMIQQWNTQHTSFCVFCNDLMESRDHLFFVCKFSEEVWKGLTQNLLAMRYTCQWDQVIPMRCLIKTELFIVRYVFQASLYAIWRERNQRKHGEGPMTPGHVIKMVDKNVHNRLSSIRDKAHTGGLSLWFGTR